MGSYSQGEIVTATRIVTVLTTKNPKLQLIFNKDAVSLSSELDSQIKETCRLKLKWHEKIKGIGPVLKKAKNVFNKYRDLIKNRLPGMSKIDWQKLNVKPDLFCLNIEKLIDFYKDNQEELPFATIAIEELNPISDELNRKLTEIKEALRLYRNSVKTKKHVLVKAEKFFYEVRRFVCRELGQNSPEYSQVKDKVIRRSAKETFQPDEVIEESIVV